MKSLIASTAQTLAAKFHNDGINERRIGFENHATVNCRAMLSTLYTVYGLCMKNDKPKLRRVSLYIYKACLNHSGVMKKGTLVKLVQKCQN